MAIAVRPILSSAGLMDVQQFTDLFEQLTLEISPLICMDLEGRAKRKKKLLMAAFAVNSAF